MSIEIRRAVFADTDRLLDLLLQVEGVHQKGRPDIFRVNGIKYTADEVEAILEDETTPVFVAVLDGLVVGYVFCIISEVRSSTLLFDMKTVHLEDVCVDENYRGKGIGNALLEYVTAWAKSVGCTRMDLDVWEFNDGARRLYERCGFTTQKRRMDKWL